MNWNITIVGIVAGLAMIVLVLELVRRRSLGERYALLWLLLAVAIIVLSAWPALLQKLADLLNIYYPPSIIFGLAFLFVFAMMIHLSAVLSRQSSGYIKMAQRLSILEERVSRLTAEKGSMEAGVDDEEGDAASG